ncbi:hypothetical protein [Sphingomonas lenta]|uniref:Type III secretion protein n=1 Tax=Sphingomonas lenta TaxID=1141887 RepID=A0A2A2SDW3_9SPHN|nr:hypothetical protein [Sphingomonas lenta]PAX07395.1 hypothetical protein CKY28_13035 [Sphingomonas lenta]
MSNTTITTNLANVAATPLTGNRMGRSGGPGTWFEALAQSWGQTLDNQAARIEQMSDSISSQGQDNPSQITKLTAESMRMSFMANSSSTSIDSVGKALETMARKN